MSNPPPIVDLLLQDHEEAKLLLAHATSAPPQDREEAFWKLVPSLVRHEVAEEVVVYPAIRDDPEGAAQAEARIKEQAEAEEMLSEMEGMDRESAEFAEQLTRLQQAVLSHADAEEKNVFPLLWKLGSDQDSEDLGVRYEKAKSSAPTRPHPNAPDTPPGNKVMGPITALFDKAREAARGL